MIRSSKLGLGFDFNNNFNHAASGVFTSEWYDTAASGLLVSWLAETVTKSAPSGTIATVEYRVNNDKSNSAWSSSIKWSEGRYAQVRVQFSKNEFAASNPEVSNVVLTPQIKGQDAITNLLTVGSGYGANVFAWDNLNSAQGATKTQVGEWTRINAGSVNSAFRGKVELAQLINGETYAVSIDVWNDSSAAVNVTMDWCDVVGAGSTVNVLAGEQKRIGFAASRSTYDSTFRFFDITIPAGVSVLVKNAQVENRPYTTQFINGTRPSPKAVMIEEGTTNLVIRSEEFNTAWTLTNVTVTADAVTAPDGTLSADKLVDNTTNGPHYTYQTPFTAGQPGAISCYLKAGEHTWAWLAFFGGNSRAWFNLKDGVVGTVEAGITATMKHVGNGWYRCSVSIASVASGNQYSIIGISTGDNATSNWTGTGTQGIYIWGAQAEQKSYPTSYLKTTSAAVTRNAETFAIPTGALASNGTVIIRAYVSGELTQSTMSRSYHLFDHRNGGTAKNLVSISRLNTGQWRAAIRDNNDVGITADYSANLTEGWHTFAIRWNSTEQSLWIDGVKRAAQLSAYAPTSFTTSYLGTVGGTANWYNGLFEDVNIFHESLTDAEMTLYTSTGYVIPLTEKHSYKLGFDDSTLTHGEGGYRITPAYDLSALETVTSGYVAWNANMPASSNVLVDVSVDNGVTWSPVLSSGQISALTNVPGSGKVMLVKTKMTTTNIAAIPSVSDRTLRVGQGWKNAASQYIKALFNKLTLVPTALSKWQLENKKYATSFINGTRNGDALSIPASGIINATSGTIIIRAYVNEETAKINPATARQLFWLENTSTFANQILIYRSTGGGWIAQTKTGTSSTSSATWTSALTPGWHTIAMRWNASELSIWIDGAKKAFSTNPSLPSIVESTIRIGSSGRSGGTSYWDDAIDEVHIFGDALTDSEMATYTNLPMNQTISVNEKHTYRHKFTNNLDYGTCGVWVSKWLDAGVNAFGTPWVGFDKEEVKPTGTSITYKFRASDTKDTNAVWYDDITNAGVKGRYIQIKAFLMSEDATTTTPEITYAEPIAQFS